MLSILLAFELNNSSYILSKTKQCFEYLSSNDKSDDPSLILPSFQIGRSFYNKSERKTTKSFYQQDFCLNNFNETVYENTVTMDLTSRFLLFNVKIIINENYVF